jgi:hypothetical protein
MCTVGSNDISAGPRVGDGPNSDGGLSCALTKRAKLKQLSSAIPK